jgi:hypothetical protein
MDCSLSIRWSNSVLLCINTVVNTTFLDNNYLYHIFRDTVIVLVDQARLLYMWFFSLALVAFTAKITVFYCESTYKMEILDLLSDYQAQSPFYKLNMKHRKSIKSKVFIMYNLFLRGFGTMTTVIFNGMILSLAIYVQVNFKVNPVIYWPTILLLLICTIDAMSMCLAAPFLVTLPISIVNYKLDELANMLKWNIKLNNHQGIAYFLSSYNNLTIIINN